MRAIVEDEDAMLGVKPYPGTRSVQSAIAAAAEVKLHVGVELAVKVLVANAGQVPMIKMPVLAAKVVAAAVSAVADARTISPALATDTPVRAAPAPPYRDPPLAVTVPETNKPACPGQPYFPAVH